MNVPNSGYGFVSNTGPFNKTYFFNGQDGLRFRIELTFKKQFQTTVANMETYHFN